jgi:acyl transferase domain-containing protein
LYDQDRPARISLPTYPFAKERYWVTDSAVAEIRPTRTEQGAQLHPLVSHNSSTLTEVSFSSRLADTDFYATDHKVNAESLFPGAGFLEVASFCGTIAAERRVHKLKDIVWIQPLSFRGGTRVLRTFLKQIGDEVEYAITSLGEDNERVVHSEGRLLFTKDAATSPEDSESPGIGVLEGRCQRTYTADEFYRNLARCGLEYGATWQVVRDLRVGESCALARLELPESLRREWGQFILHPTLIDGALQTIAGLLAGVDSAAPYLPFALDEVDIVRPLSQTCYVWTQAVRSDEQSRMDVRKFDIQLLNERGEPLVRLKNLYARRLGEARMVRRSRVS